MPLYEYECLGCGHRFEALVLKTEPAGCPSCQRQELRRLISTFAVSSEQTRQSSLRAARTKSASVAKDKAIAEREAIEHHHH